VTDPTDTTDNASTDTDNGFRYYLVETKGPQLVIAFSADVRPVLDGMPINVFTLYVVGDEARILVDSALPRTQQSLKRWLLAYRLASLVVNRVNPDEPFTAEQLSSLKGITLVNQPLSDDMVTGFDLLLGGEKSAVNILIDYAIMAGLGIATQGIVAFMGAGRFDLALIRAAHEARLTEGGDTDHTDG
jgi:hypothetical protein